MTKKEEQELKRQRKLQAELERLEGMLVYERVSSTGSRMWNR